MARAVADRYPALAASAALHGAVLACFLIAWPWGKTLHMGEVVPVTLMTSADLPAPAPAVQAPAPTPAATETPVPQAAPQPAAPHEAPTPAPPTPRTQPTPPTHSATPATTQPTHAPTPAKAKPTPQPKEDWAALAASLEHQAQPAATRPSSAPRGPTRPAQAVQARTTTGTSDAASTAALGSLAGELQRLWNPNCEAQGAADVTIKVTFKLGASGRLIGSPQSSQSGATDPVVRASSDRAVRAVEQGEPFTDLPSGVYGQNITVNFNQKSFCSNR